MRPPLPTVAEPLVTYADIRRRSPDTCRRARNSLISPLVLPSPAPLARRCARFVFFSLLFFFFLSMGLRGGGVAVEEVLERGVARL